MQTDSKWIYRKDYTPHPFQITHASLDFDIREDVEVTATLHLRRNPHALDQLSELVLQGETLTLRSIHLNGTPLPSTHYVITENTLSIPNVPDHFVLETKVGISPDTNTALEGLYRSGDMLCTQNEPEGFRKITYFIDRPDNLSRFTVRIAADKVQYPVLLSNGNKTGEGDLPDNRHYVTWEDPYPKPSYLFALVAGDFDKVEDTHITAFSKRQVQLQIFVDKGYRSQAYFALESLKKAMVWDEQRFGLEYDLDVYMIVAAQAFNMGAMENKGLNLFNAKYVLADTHSATDNDYLHIEAVIGHEYFHNWTGNRITCRDWFQLTLKEGLTVFRDEEFTADLHSRAVKRIQDIRYLREHQYVEDASPLAHPIQPDRYKEINNFYTATVYNKGAAVIRMLHTCLGETRFQKGIANYLKTHDGSAATTTDFIDAFRPYSTIDLDHFSDWYHQSGTPLCNITDAYDADRCTYTITCKQTHSDGKESNFLMPCAIALFDKTGLPLTVTRGQTTAHEHLVVIQSPVQQLVFSDVLSPPIPSLFRNGTAPVHVTYAYDEHSLIVLMGHDTDPINRFEAAETLMINAVKHRLSSSDYVLPVAFLQSFAAILDDTDVEPAYIAETLTFPSVSRISDVLKDTRFGAIADARHSLMTQIAKTHEPLLHRQEKRASRATTSDWNTLHAGYRHLRLLCLGYLRFAGCDYLDLIYQTYKNSNTMTEKIGTLALLCHIPSAETDAALKDFEKEWSHHPLVMQKWFSVQANATHDKVIETTKALLDHPLMDIKNPNFIRSLIGTFSYNLPYFHHASGEGYRLLASVLSELDPINPQTASRLAKRFQVIHTLPESCQVMIKTILKDALDKKPISKDTEEVLGTLGILG